MWKPNYKFGYVFAAGYIAAFVAAIILYTGSGPWWVAAYLIHVCIFGFGVSFGLHRAISHRMAPADSNRVRLAALVGTLANVGSPIDFMLTHRTHHRFADGPQDPQNVSHLGWRLLFGMRRESAGDEPLIDLFESRRELKQAYFQWLHRNYYLVLLAHAASVYLLAGTRGLLFLALIPSGLSFFALGSLNYFGHQAGSHSGARNIVWLLPLILTECWHGDHHAA